MSIKVSLDDILLDFDRWNMVKQQQLDTTIKVAPE